MAIPNIDEEAAEVEVLQSRLEKTIELTTKISLSLSKLSASASNVEEAVKPIYGKTQSLTSLAESEFVLPLDIFGGRRDGIV